MSRTYKDSNNSITRDLKIDENTKRSYQLNEIPLKSVTQKFIKEPLTLEALDKRFKQTNEISKKEDEKLVVPKKRNKKAEEKAIFYDIFVRPKEMKIKEIIEKRNQKNKVEVTGGEFKHKTYISNKLTKEGKIVGMNGQGVQNQFDFKSYVTNKPIVEHTVSSNLSKEDTYKLSKNTQNSKLKTEEEKEEKSIEEKPEKKDEPATEFKNQEILHKNINAFLKSDDEIDVTKLNNFLHEKYIINKSSPESAKKNYFNQLIQIRPPEGINAVVASPLMDSKGWAPSIPSMNIDKLNTNLKDLMTRAKGGIKAGDITKEAHMAFYLGIMNEEEKKYETALKFYKKYFLTAKLLQDIYGTELALNRIAVLFGNIFDYAQSIYYNEKHKEITTHNLNGFVSYYNCGVCYRITQNFTESLSNFDSALKLSEEENDLESYTLCLAQLAITHIFMGNMNEYIEFSEQFFNKNKSLNHIEMELEMQILSGFVYNYTGNLEISRAFYSNSLNNAIICENEKYKSLSLCNIGIIEANKDFDNYMDALSDPNLAEKMMAASEEEAEKEEGNYGQGGEGENYGDAGEVGEQGNGEQQEEEINQNVVGFDDQQNDENLEGAESQTNQEQTENVMNNAEYEENEENYDNQEQGEAED